MYRSERKMKNFIHFRYVYSFYSDGELTLEDVFDERFEITEGCRFTIHDQEDGSFLISEIKDTAEGRMAVLTFPNKDNMCLYQGRAGQRSCPTMNTTPLWVMTTTTSTSVA